MRSLVNHSYHVPQVASLGETTFDKQLLMPLVTAYVTVLICKRGSAIFNINFNKYVVKAHGIVVLYDDTFVMLQQCSRSALFDYILLEKAFASDVAFQLPNPLFAFFNESPVLHVKQEDWKSLQQWQRLLSFIIQQQGEYATLMLCNHVQNFFLMIANKMPQTPLKQKAQQSRKEQLCWRFWDMITQYCKVHREVQFYAQKLAVTPFYLSQITKSFFNDTPKALIDRQVILEIKALLGAGNKSIKEVAVLLNFEDTSYLCRYFKRHTGVTLSHFRKNHGYD
uniref:AraC family transcriptional regulator n=1 Tax=Providencia stuartii TaxID=588 RepID=A0AAI9MVZ3_PROST|nr:AraC family transcriptional regulator [Providencia stuartii]